MLKVSIVDEETRHEADALALWDGNGAVRLLDADRGRGATLCTELAATGQPSILANRDFHLGNVLAAQREPWLAIDPKPLVGEPAFDTGHLVRSLLPARPTPHEARRLIRRLADELDLDPERIRAWAVLRSIEDALWILDTYRADPDWDLACARVLARRAIGR